MVQQPGRFRTARARRGVHRRPDVGRAGRGGRADDLGGRTRDHGAPAAAGRADAAAYPAALAALARRPYGTAELQAALVRRGHPAGAVRQALERLAALGYLNDREYARLLARRLTERQRVGPARLRAALAARSLSPEVVAAASAEAFAEVDEPAAAVAAARRRLRSLRGIASRDPEAARRRLAGYLSRRGYGAEIIARALRTLLGKTGGGDPDEN